MSNVPRNVRSFAPQQPQLTMLDIEYLLRKYGRATWATLSMAKTLREPLFGGIHQQDPNKKVNTPPKLVLAVSTMDEQLAIAEQYDIPELVDALNVKEHELRRLGFTTWNLPNMLLDTTLKAREGHNEMIYDRVESGEEDLASAYWTASDKQETPSTTEEGQE